MKYIYYLLQASMEITVYLNRSIESNFSSPKHLNSFIKYVNTPNVKNNFS